MGTVEGDESSSDVDSYDAVTQQIDTQFYPEGCRDDDFLNITNTMPSHDTYILEDEFETQMANLHEETQMVDLDRETQVMNFEEETQMVDLYEETQMVDLYDETQVVDLPGETQVLDEFNAELDGAESRQNNNTDVMFETQRISGDGSAKIDESVSGELESTVDKDPPKEESSPRGFTSIRAASIRASGLAAHSRGASSGLSTSSTDKSSLEQQTSELDGSLKFGSEGVSNKHKNGSKAARKLFEENKDAEVDHSETETIQTDDNLDMPELLATEDCVAGLSYVESQEPGELSQARALEVVDRFLDISFLKQDEGSDKKVRNIEKPQFVSAAKGSRDLAKRSTLRNSVGGGGGIYDWDDAREDDGGGEFFLRKKELFFDKEGPKRRCLTEPRKSKSVKDSDEKEKQCTKPKLGYSVLLPRQRAKKKSLWEEEAPQKNIIRNLEERLFEVSGPELSDNGADEGIPNMRNIGPDTQMAAEAMGDLCFEVNLDGGNDSGDKGVCSTGKAARQNKSRADRPKEYLPYSTSVGVVTRQAKRTKRITTRNSSESSGPLNEHRITKKGDDRVLGEEFLPYSTSVGVVTRQAKRTKRITTRNSSESSGPLNEHRITKKGDDRVLGEAEGARLAADNVSTHHEVELTGQSEKSYMEDKLGFSVPVAHRTRKSAKLNCPKGPASSVDARGVANDVVSACACRKKTASRDKNSVTMTIEEIKKVGLARLKQSNKTCLDKRGASDIKATINLQGKRSSKEASAVTQHCERLTRSSAVPASIPRNPDKDRLNHPSPCLGSESRKIISKKTVNARNSIPDDAVGKSTSKQGDDKNYCEASSVGSAERNVRHEATPRCGTSYVNCATPATRSTLRQDASPICMGDEYHKQSCRKNLSTASLIREINELRNDSPEPYGGMRESRKRKDITAVRVLFSQHLDDDVVKHQKKILARLGGAVASSMLDATHFVADEFVRTRNMLEAIASGKPVVTRLWIESCGQASCLIDEKNYILRDAKKEKEFGFCLPVTLARASQRPLLKGQKVFVTPNTKPGKDILINLIKAVHGLPIERLGRSVLKDEHLPDDLLILSCEEDYDACVPFLEKGGAIYSSELLLNGIVKQKLEFERHGLFADNVKRTRSTIWLRKTNKFRPVKK